MIVVHTDWLDRQREFLHLKLEAQSQKLLPQLAAPGMEALRAFAWILDEWAEEMHEELELAEELASLLRHSVLQSAFPALLYYRRGDSQAASAWLTKAWIAQAVTLGAVEFSELPAPASLAAPAPGDLEFLASYTLAACELLSTRLQDAQGRTILRRLMTHLALSYDDLARVFQVPAALVRRWEKRQEEIPVERMSELAWTDALLARLLALFRPERLPQVIRRKAELFSGEPALEWILRGRLDAVAERYEAALRY